MPWQECSIVSQRHEFCLLASQPDVNLAELCRRHRISRKTAYKWIGRFRQAGSSGLSDRSRRPRASPLKTPPAMEQAIVLARQTHPAWAGRKLRRLLQNQGQPHVPAASTIQQVIVRNGLPGPDRPAPKPFLRFEHPAPNDLWQMDFKGHFAVGLQGRRRCHPLTILDDHSRFCLALQGCDNEQADTVQAVLERVFQTYGLPGRILCDNGTPWGDQGQGGYTRLGVWLLRLGVSLSHGRPFHPQTQGKDERFHRTINVELIGTRCFADVAHFQRLADPWRELYNCVRPHEALRLDTPASRYRSSRRAFPASLPAIQYDTCDQVRKVCVNGSISFRGRYHKIGKAFTGQPVAIRPTEVDGVMKVYFCHQPIKELDLRASVD